MKITHLVGYFPSRPCIEEPVPGSRMSATYHHVINFTDVRMSISYNCVNVADKLV